MNKKEIKSILEALNSTSDLGFKYPIGNKDLTVKVKELEQKGFITYTIYGKWVKS